MKKGMMYKIFALITAAILVTGCASGGESGDMSGLSDGAKDNELSDDTSDKDAGSDNDTAEGGDTDKISIVCTIFPAYSWASEIVNGSAGDMSGKFEITYLTEGGSDMHSYQITTADIMKINSADLFIYVGGESDEWVYDVLENDVSSEINTINMMACIEGDLRTEEIVEGMQEDSHEHSHDEDVDEHDEDSADEADSNEDGSEPGNDQEADAEHDEEESEYDEHVWLSLKNAKSLCEIISAAVCELDLENADIYTENCSAYTNTIDELDGKYADAIKNAEIDTIIVGDRFPFLYMVHDYGLSYYAAFSGCSAETEATFETITFLADKMNELGVKKIVQIETSDGSVAKTVLDGSGITGGEVITLNSMQGVSSEDVSAGTTYIDIMEDNLALLEGALN